MLYGGDLENVDRGKDAGAYEAQAHRQDPRDGDLQAADIEHPTFYYHFRDKYDPAAWMFCIDACGTDITSAASSAAGMNKMKQEILFYKRAYEDVSMM